MRIHLLVSLAALVVTTACSRDAPTAAVPTDQPSPQPPPAWVGSPAAAHLVIALDDAAGRLALGLPEEQRNLVTTGLGALTRAIGAGDVSAALTALDQAAAAIGETDAANPDGVAIGIAVSRARALLQPDAVH